MLLNILVSISNEKKRQKKKTIRVWQIYVLKEYKINYFEGLEKDDIQINKYKYIYSNKTIYVSQKVLQGDAKIRGIVIARKNQDR